MRFLFILLSSLSILSCTNDTPTDSVSLPVVSTEGITVAEEDENTTIDLTLSLDKPFSSDVIINYSTSNGTAESGADYKSISGQSLTFEKGDLSKTVTLTIVGDLFKEATESFYFEITSAINASIATPKVEITITDTDTEEAISDFQVPTTGYISPASYDGYTLVWQDEFEGEEIANHWKFEIGTGSNGWGNNEKQYYRAENTSLKDGALVIEAKRENFGGRSYTSSRMITQGMAEFQYGRIDIRAVLPKGQGIWPALWMLGGNFNTVGWPRCGEIDIMEMIGGSGRENNVFGTLHWDNNGSHACTCGQGSGYTLSEGTFADEWHVFSIVWDQNKIEWFVDNNSFKVIDVSQPGLEEFQNEFFFILIIEGNLIQIRHVILKFECILNEYH